MSANTAVSSQLSVRKLHPALGAEVRGIDMRRDMSPELFQELHDIWMEHLVLVFPEQHMTDEEHVRFTRHFGEPEIFHQKIIRSQRMPEIFRVSNVNDDDVLDPVDACGGGCVGGRRTTGDQQRACQRKGQRIAERLRNRN